MSIFEETENKRIIRQKIDLPFIKKAAERITLASILQESKGIDPIDFFKKGIKDKFGSKQATLDDEIYLLQEQIEIDPSQHIPKSLVYFGLPGAKAYDIKDWKDYICNICAVEKDCDSRYEMQTSLVKIGFSAAEFTIYKCEIEDLIETDKNQKVLKPAQLVNFDWYGQLLTPGDRSRRLDALEEYIKIQNRLKVPAFLMLITILAGRSPGAELVEFLESARSYVVKEGNNADDIFDWLSNHAKPHECLLVATPIIVILYGGFASYDTSCLYILKYKGTGDTVMLHFLFWFRHTGQRTPYIVASRFRPIPLRDVKIINNGVIEDYDWGIPEFVEHY